ncbi:MAG: Ig-like domain-containing protein, partial [Halieaceae bacterium]|nr:Ig-like domain-containing protein [Halieaceae bacterium]
SDGTVTYTPNADYFVSDTIVYTVSDGNGGTDTANVPVTVNPINDAPVGNADTALSTNQDVAVVSGDLLGNDTDIDGDALIFGELSANNGAVISNGDGTVTYTPNSGFVGNDTITYIVSDNKGGIDTVTVAVTVLEVNQPPAISDQTFSVDENSSVTDQVVATDANGDTVTFNVIQGVSFGQLVFNGSGAFTYTPNAGFVGSDGILVEVNDGQGGTAQATISFTVNNVNDAPVANNDPDANTLEDEPVTILGVLSNDTDADSDTLNLVSGAAVSGSVSVSGANLIYTPNQDFNGTDTVTYTVSDGNGGTDTAQVKVVVAPVNDPPIAVNDSGYSTPFETAVTLSNLLANDSDVDGDVISITSVNGSGGQALLNADQSITFTPASGFSGQATVTYVVSDAGGLTATGIATLTVSPSNSAPTAVDDTGVVMEAGTTIVLDSILNNDSDADGDAISLVSAATTVGTVSVSSSTSLSVSIPKDTSATLVQVTYTIQDTEGQTAEATVTIEVIPDNFAPIANDDEAITIYEGEVAPAQDVLANDTDADGDTLTVVSAGATSGAVTINSDDTLSYTPNSGFTGDDVVTYTIDDGRGARDTASFVVSVLPNVPDAPANQAPSANNDSPLSTDFGVALDVIDVLANDYDPDGDKLTVVQAGANHGVVTINADSTLRYVPNEGFSGSDIIKYTISDGKGGRDDATLTVTVAAGGTNTPPRAFDDGPFDISSGETQIEFNVLSNDVDPDGDELELLNASAQDGKVVALPDGFIRYTKPEQFDGKDIITYTISDGQGGVATARAIIQGPATIPNRPPSALDDGPFIIFQGGRAKDIDVLANDNDPDGDFLTITSVSADSGVASISDDNTIDYVAASDYLGLVRITYSISDGQGETATAVLTVEVQAPPQNNTPPSSRSINFEVTTDVALTSILPAATDAEGDAIRYVLAIAPKDGTVKIEGNGRFSYTPDTSFVGLDTFFFYVTDGQLNSRNYQVTLDIDGDSDGDGYLDSVDQCVNTAPDLRVDSTGCAVEEAEDFDGDGVANEIDNCPSTPAGQSVDENGCSTEQVEEVVEDFRDLTDDVDEVSEIEVVKQETKNLASTVNSDCNNSIGQGVTSGQQSNLGSACQSLKSGENSSEQVKNAVEEIDYEEVGTLSDNAIASTSNQTQAVGQRMQVVNTGGGGGSVSVDGLNIRYGKQSIPTIALQEAVNALLGFAAGEGEAEDGFIDFGKLGIFIQGDLDFGDRDSSDTQTGYESDSWNLTLGGDYRFKDNLYGGVAFNFGQTDVEYDKRGDESTIENWGMSVYGGWQITEAWYVDGLISYGNSDYSTLRNIEYTLNTGDFSATQRGDTTGTQLSYGINTGYMYNKKGFRFGPILSFFYSDGTIDGFKERAIKGSDAWAFEVGEQTIQSTRMSAGLQMDYSWSTDWGVLIPGVRAAYVREKEGSDDTVVVRLANGANFADGTSRFAIANQKDDEGYYDISVNVSGQFVMGVSGFISYQFYQDYRGYSREGYSIGVRWDRPF